MGLGGGGGVNKVFYGKFWEVLKWQIEEFVNTAPYELND